MSRFDERQVTSLCRLRAHCRLPHPRKFRVQDTGFRIQGSGYRVQDADRFVKREGRRVVSPPPPVPQPLFVRWLPPLSPAPSPSPSSGLPNPRFARGQAAHDPPPFSLARARERRQPPLKQWFRYGKRRTEGSSAFSALQTGLHPEPCILNPVS